MPHGLQKPESRGDLRLLSDTDDPIVLYLDYEKFKGGIVQIPVTYEPNTPAADQEWNWEPGPAAAGNSRETDQSHAGGGSSYGKFVNLRRDGVAQPTGRLHEVPLPHDVAVFVGGAFTDGLEWGAGQDFFFTTAGPYIVCVPGGSGTPEITTKGRNTGAGGITTGLATFSWGTGDYLECGDAINGIQEWNGTAWAAGAAGDIGATGTACGRLAVPYWTFGEGMATGGLTGNGGRSAHTLVGVTANGAFEAHCAGNPKIAGNWSAQARVGMGGAKFPVLGICQSSNTVWFTKANGVFGLDGLGYSPPLTPWQALCTHPLNNLSVAFWANLIWVGTVAGLMAFTPDGQRVDLASFVQFGAMGSNNTPIFGRPVALAPAPEGLWVAYWDGTDSYIGMLKTNAGNYRWSMAEAVILGQQVTLLRQAAPGGIPRLWIGTGDPDRKLHLWYQELPVSGDGEQDYLNGRVADGSFTPVTDWEITLSRFNGGSPVPKTFREYRLEADQLGATSFPDNTVTVSVSPDGDPFITQGTAVSRNWISTPKTDLVRSQSAQVNLTVHNDPTAPVVLRSFATRYTPHPRLTRYTSYPVVFSKARTDQDPRVVMARLERTPELSPITYIDHLGRTNIGMVQPQFQEVFTGEAEGNEYVGHATVVISTTQTSALWGEAVLGIDEFA